MLKTIWQKAWQEQRDNMIAITFLAGFISQVFFLSSDVLQAGAVLVAIAGCIYLIHHDVFNRVKASLEAENSTGKEVKE
jgi:hypothetical protein